MIYYAIILSNIIGLEMIPMKKDTTKTLCVKAMLCALVCVATIAIQVPVPATSGYIHLGDSIILLAGIMFGPMFGLTAGGIGSALADIFTGYGYWAPFTLIIKGLMGYAAGKIAFDGSDKAFGANKFLGAAVAEIIMIAGYLIGGTILKGSFLVSLTSVPSNAVQAVGGAILYFVIAYGVKKTGILKVYNNKKA